MPCDARAAALAYRSWSVLLCIALGACAAQSARAPATAAATPEPASQELSAESAAAAALNDAARDPSMEAPQDLASAPAGPGWLGVELAKREDGEGGVLIRSVMRGSPAERAGIAPNDIVLSIDGENVARPHDLRERVIAARAGARVSLGVLRGADTRLFGVDLEPVPNDDEVMRKNYLGARAPDFGALDTVQGSITPALPALKGRVVVLEFWATWCNVCHLMAPTLNGWNDRYAGQGVTVLGVTTDPVGLASQTAGQLRMGYALASDATGNMQRAYRAYALPTLFVIDKHGNVRDVLIGYSAPRLREIEVLVRKLIAEG